jgi:hypothetical protein
MLGVGTTQGEKEGMLEDAGVGTGVGSWESVVVGNLVVGGVAGAFVGDNEGVFDCVAEGTVGRGTRRGRIPRYNVRLVGWSM